MRKTLVLALLALTACDRGPEEVPPEVLAARQEASRRACVANEVLQRAADELATLQQAAQLGAGPAGELGRRAAGAALEYAQAYYQHAELRAAAVIQIDSAMSHSPTGADSLRHVRSAQQLSPRTPEPGTLEANVFTAYQQDFGSIYTDPDHPCNWETPEEGAAPR